MLTSHPGSCKAEAHNCLLSNQMDASWNETILEWTAKCSTKTSSSLTTPRTTLATALYDDASCGKAQQACEKFRYEMSVCTAARTTGATTACRCGLDMVSRESMCLSYKDTCLMSAMNVSTWAVFSLCPTAQSFLQVRLVSDLT